MTPYLFRRPAKGSQSGFTLAELVVAMAILGTATWGAGQGIKASLTATRKAMDRLYAVHYAQHWLDYYRNNALSTSGYFTDAPPGRLDPVRNVYYRLERTYVAETGATPGKLTIQITPYRERLTVWPPANFDPARVNTVTVWSYYYSKAIGK